MDTKFIFCEIQPLCIDVTKKCDLKSIRDLEKYLDNLLEKEESLNDSISVINDLKEYISIPLLLILKKESFKSKGQEFLEAVLQCLGKILSKSSCVDWNFFRDVLSLLFRHVTSTENPQIVASISEESKIEILKSISFLCQALPSEHWPKFYSVEFRPQLGHAVYVCLQIAEKEKNRHLKILALNTIQELGLKTHLNQFDSENEDALSFAFASFLPGIAMASTRIAMSGEIQSHKVIVTALECWQYFVFLVMRDKFLSSLVEDLGVQGSLLLVKKKMFPEEKKKRKNDKNLEKGKGKISQFSAQREARSENSTPRLQNVDINADWVNSTSEKLSVLVKSLITLVSHSHWKVRHTLIHWCQSLLQHCSRSMNKCLILCLETLITLKSDPEAEISHSADDALRLFMEDFDADEEENLMEVLEERVFALTTRLPTIIKTQDDTKILSSVLQLLGSLEVMGGKVESLVQISSHLQRLLRALIILLTYDYSDPDLLMEKLMTEDSLELMSVKTRLGLSFRYFRSEAVVISASSCCALLGRHGDLLLVIDQVLDLVQESALQRNETLLILNLVLKGSINQNVRATPEEREKIADSVIGLLLDLGVFEAPLSVSHDEAPSKEDELHSSLVSFHSFKPAISIDLAKRNVILVANSLKLIGSCALFLQKSFDVFLNRVLCSVMEKAGETNVLVSHEALLTLENVATSCSYQSISELIEYSVPFFWFPLSQKLKRLPEFPSSPQVLRVVLRCHKGEVKVFVEELVEDVLDSLDSFHTESSLPLLSVLLSFVDALVATNVDAVGETEMSGSTTHEKETPIKGKGTLRDFLEELHANHKALAREMEKENATEETILSAEEGFKKYHQEKEQEKDCDESFEKLEEGKEKEKEVPKHISLVVQILERCSYLLFVKDRKSQLAILQIIKCSCHILQNWENQKLPCYHKIWKPLIHRLKDKDFVVLLKALEACVLMVKTSGDFLRRRFLQDLFPSLIFFLETQCNSSLNKPKRSGYYLTPAFKAQRHVLGNMPSLLQDIQLEVMEASDLLRAVLPYVDDRQPFLLSELAFKVVEALTKFHPDLVWLTIAFSKGPFRITPPSPLLNPVIISGSKKENLNPKILKLFESLS